MDTSTGAKLLRPLVVFIRFIRFLVGMLVFFLGTCLISLYTIIAYNLGLYGIADGSYAFRFFSQLAHTILGGPKVVIENLCKEDLTDHNRPVVWLGNHPLDLELTSFVIFCRTIGGTRAMIPTFKREMLKTVMGPGLKATRGLPIDRAGGKATIDAIKHWATEVVDPRSGVCIGIFPDGTRNRTQEIRDTVCEKMCAKITDDEQKKQIEDICQVTMPPRVGGLHCLRQVLPDDTIFLLCVIVADKSTKLWDLFLKDSITVHCCCKDVKLSKDRDEMSAQLLDCWTDFVVPYITSHRKSA